MSCPTHGARRFDTLPLVGKTELGDGVFVLDFEWIGPEPLPGQYFMLRPARTAALLARPISVFGWTPPGGTTASGRLRFLVARRGTGTADLVDMRPGEAAELSGPLGVAWPEFGRTGAPLRLALVGGGVGVAPLAFLARSLPAGSCDFYAGFRSTPYGLEDLGARSLTIATEDGSAGVRGRIPDVFDPAGYGAVCACGPEAMMRAVADACARSGVECWLSLERRMACGVGACLGCTVRTVNGNRRCCVDGPVFDAKEYSFDD